jgi:hypothetical protein
MIWKAGRPMVRYVTKSDEGQILSLMELLIHHRKSVVEEKRKWEEYLRNLDRKIGIYQEGISGT